AITIDARSIVPSRLRALNWTGNKARSQVERTLARHTSVGVIRKSLRTTPASPAKLTYEVGVSGAHIPLAEFHAAIAAAFGLARGNAFPHCQELILTWQVRAADFKIVYGVMKQTAYHCTLRRRCRRGYDGAGA